MGSVSFPVSHIYKEAVGVTEFRHHLTAHTAWICRLRYPVFTADYGDGNKFPLAFTYCLEKCRALCAVCRRISRIFYVTAEIDLAGGGKKCRADAKSRIRGIGSFSCFRRKSE